MSYGLRVRDSSGNITLDGGFELTIERYTNVVTGSGSAVLSDTSGRRTAMFSYLLNPTYDKVPHSVDLSGATFSWAEGTLWGYAVSGTSVVGLIFC